MEPVKESVRRYWDKEAGGFDLAFGHGLRSMRHKEMWLDILKRNIQGRPSSRILDVGCGTGFLTLLLSEMGHEAAGLDFSTEMLRVARGKAKTNGLDIEFFNGDAEKPPFPPESFDHVVCRHLIWTLPHPEHALKRWRQLLQPGGSVVLVEGRWKQRGRIAGIRNFLADIIQTLEEKKRPKAWGKNYVPNTEDLPFFGGRPSDVLMKIMKEAGFVEIWKDGLNNLLEHEHSNAPLSYRIRFIHRRERRFLVGGKIDGAAESQRQPN